MNNPQRNHHNSSIKNIVIVGADVIGWCAAVGLARGLQGQQISITVLDIAHVLPDQDAVIHCTPHLFDFHRLLGIQDKPLLVNGQAKLCSGTQFVNFSEQQTDYFMGCESAQPSFCTVELHHVLHWLGIKENAPYSLSALAAAKSLLALPTNNKDEISAGFSPSLNLDAISYLGFMQGAANHLGVKHIKAVISQVHYHSESGFIKQLDLANGISLHTDLVLDNSGREDVFDNINQQRSYVDCSALLPFDKKISARVNVTHQAKPYQKFIATSHGVIEMSYMPQWHNAIMHYCSKTCSDEQAKSQLSNWLPDIQTCEISQVTIGFTDKFLVNNCFALGNTAGYLGTSPFSNLVLCQRSISKLLELFPGKACLPANTAELNRRISKDYQQALDYGLLMLMYSETKPQFLWQRLLEQLPATLQQKIALFSCGGRVSSELNPLVSRDRWITLLKHKVQQRQGYEPVLDALDKSNGRQFLQNISEKIKHCLHHYRPYN